MKKLILMLLSTLVISSLIFNAAAAASKNGGEPGYKVTVKTGAVKFTDVYPMDLKDITYIPLRAVFEQLGCEVTWDPDTRTVIIKNGKSLLLYPTGGNKAFLNGEEKTFSPEGIILKNRTFVPVEFFSALGMEVQKEGTSISLICKSCSQDHNF